MSGEVHRNYMDAKQAYWKAERELAIARADLTMAERALRQIMDLAPQPANPVGALPPRAPSSQPADSSGAQTGGGK